MGTYSIQHYSAKYVDAFWLFLCVHCGVNGTKTSNTVIRPFFFLDKTSIDYFNISKINVKLKHEFTAHFQKHLH